MRKNFTESEISFLKTNYKRLGGKYCSKKLKRAYNCIIVKANRLGLRVYNKPIDISIFKNPQTKEIAYILGLLWADGCVSGNRISINNIKSDTIDFQKTFFKIGDWNIFDGQKYNWKPYRAIHTTNKQIAKFLCEKDYHAKSEKSANKILKIIPTHLHRYWFRGLFDGDGTIYTKKRSYCLDISSSYGQDWSYMKNLCSKFKIKYTIYRERKVNKTTGKYNSSSKFAIYRKDDISKFCNFIFYDRNIDKMGIKRKYKKWSKIKLKIMKTNKTQKTRKECVLVYKDNFIKFYKSEGLQDFFVNNIPN